MPVAWFRVTTGRFFLLHSLIREALHLTFRTSHRPGLKQLLFIFTRARDGATPIHLRAASGNITDDTTHRDTWDLLCRLAGRRDFLYVADCKLESESCAKQ